MFLEIEDALFRKTLNNKTHVLHSCSPDRHRQRVAFNIAGLVHQLLADAAPAYLADDCHLLSDAGRRPLRSHFNDIRKLVVPQTHYKLGDRSFSAAGPRL